eukprot:993396_1
MFNANNTDVIVGYCADNRFNAIENNNNIKPEECKTGWIINNIFYNLTDISLISSNCADNNNNITNNITFHKKNKIKDLCLAFYSRDGECLLPGEEENALNKKPEDCGTPSF